MLPWAYYHVFTVRVYLMKTVLSCLLAYYYYCIDKTDFSYFFNASTSFHEWMFLIQVEKTKTLSCNKKQQKEKLLLREKQAEMITRKTAIITITLSFLCAHCSRDGNKAICFLGYIFFNVFQLFFLWEQETEWKWNKRLKGLLMCSKRLQRSLTYSSRLFPFDEKNYADMELCLQEYLY